MAAEPLPGTARATEQAQRFRDAAEKIRSRTDLTAKALGAVGTAAVAGVGYAKFADVFPYDGPSIALVGLAAGLIGMVVAVVSLVWRFSKASGSVFTSADVDNVISTNSLDGEEEKILREKYERMAKLNEVDSLSAYQARAYRFERIADRLPGTEGEPLRARAGQIMSELLATQNQVSTLIVRYRANQAVYGTMTLFLIGLFILSWYGTALSADALEGRRSGEVDIAKSCGEAAEKGGTFKSGTPAICGEADDEELTPTQEAAKAARDGVAAILAARNACLDKADEAGAGGAVCEPLQRALAAAGESSP